MPTWIAVALGLLALICFMPLVLLWLDELTGSDPDPDELRTSQGRKLPARPPRSPGHRRPR